jgi:multidrug transporter EmrE-like cation transporter
VKWIHFSLALLFETVGFATLKFSHGFTKTIPNIATVLADLLALLFFVLALRKFETGFVYIIATGAGTVLVVLTNAIVFRQTLNWVQIASIILILTGSIGLQSQGSKY